MSAGQQRGRKAWYSTIHISDGVVQAHLPTYGIVERFASQFVPHNSGLSLVCDTNGCKK